MADKDATNPVIEQIDPTDIPETVPILATSQFVLYPFMIAPLVVKDPNAVEMINDVASGTRMIGLFTPTEPEETAGENNAINIDQGTYDGEIHRIGSVAMLLRMLKIPDGSLRLLVHGLRRVRIVERLGNEPYPRARIEPIEEIPFEGDEAEAMKMVLRDLVNKTVSLSSTLSEDLIVAANNTEDPGRLADMIASNLSLPLDEQQKLLEMNDTRQRLEEIQQVLSREFELAKLGSKIQNQVKSGLDRVQRDYFLREQMKAIRKELGEEGEAADELDELREEIEKKKLPAHARKVASKELNRLRTMSPASAEFTVGRTYLDWILSLPWEEGTRDKVDLKRAREILDEDHYDLEKVKEKILEYLAVIKLRKAIRGPILCLVGPPGVGKTSLGRSVARSMGRKFVRISLGGVRDEAEIRGHRRTYIGAMPGRIIKSLKDAEANNPVFMLDEIDKLGTDFRGDPASALLEVLDPEQNFHFTDHYLDMPFDLSNIMFITTANTLDTIPSPLIDRMEVLRLSGYTMREKTQIAQQYLIPRAMEYTGIKKRQIEFETAAVETVIENYTREPGLRNLEREITNLCRKVARGVAEGKKRKTTITPNAVTEMLGPIRYDRDVVTDRTQTPGVAVGLAWTATGGDILYIESTATEGEGRLTLTGQLGDVMKESAQAARTYLHAHARELGLSEKLFKERNIHLHVPAGAIPKDGPSAGVTLMTSLASLLRGVPIRDRLAMTGEITIKGAVLPVGGIKEKILAAHRSGVEHVIIPKRNEKDLVDVPPEIREKMTIHFAESADEVLALALETGGKGGKKRAATKQAGKKKAAKITTTKKTRKKSAARKAVKKAAKKGTAGKKGTAKRGVKKGQKRAAAKKSARKKTGQSATKPASRAPVEAKSSEARRGKGSRRKK